MSLETICSMEHEYGVYSSIIESHSNIVDSFLDGIDENLILFKQKGSNRMFLKNGMFLYRDCALLEVALPECSSPYELVCYDRAADLLLENTSKKLGFEVFKLNVSNNFRAGSCHENYFYKSSSSNYLKNLENYEKIRTKIFPLLIPFLLTRYIFCGNGNYHKGEYMISQRASLMVGVDFIRSDVLASTIPVLFHSRNEPLCTNGFRIHLTSGDCNMSEFCNYLKVGTSALVLKMIEHNFLSNDFNILNAMDALKKINYDLSCKKKEIISKEFKIPFLRLFERIHYHNAIDIQKRYLEKAEKFVKKYKLDDDIIKKWDHTLSVLEKNPEELNNSIDWIIKKKLIDSAENEGTRDAINFQYHAIGSHNFFSKISEKMNVKTIVKNEEVQKALYEPPNTRALTRKELTEILVGNDYEIVGMNWDYIVYKNLSNRFKINLSTPFYVLPNDSSITIESL